MSARSRRSGSSDRSPSQRTSRRPREPGQRAGAGGLRVAVVSGRRFAVGQSLAGADAVAGDPVGAPAGRRSPHGTADGVGLAGAGPQRVALASAGVRRGRVGGGVRSRSVRLVARGGGPAARRPAGPRAGSAVRQRGSGADPGRGAARGAGVRGEPGRVAQRLDQRLVLRRLRRGRERGPPARPHHARHHLGPQQGPSSRPEATAVHPHDQRRRRRAGVLHHRQRQPGGRPHALRDVGPAASTGGPARSSCTWPTASWPAARTWPTSPRAAAGS